MLKTILKLNGAQELSRSDQKSINGGMGPLCNTSLICGGTGHTLAAAYAQVSQAVCESHGCFDWECNACYACW